MPHQNPIKLIESPNIKVKTIDFVEENIRAYLQCR